MLGTRVVLKRGKKDEAEKPFWISYADMMTALMVLFLVVMAAALLAIPKKALDAEADGKRHQKEIEEFMQQLKQDATGYPGIQVDVHDQLIDYGARAKFGIDQWKLPADAEAALRGFVPVILSHANSAEGRKLLKQVEVVGYTDKTGTYLHNLNLSLKRSQGVLCALLAPAGSGLLSDDQKRQVRNLFFVGGYSSNEAKDNAEDSRRVEMRLKFYGLGESAVDRSVGLMMQVGACEV